MTVGQKKLGGGEREMNIKHENKTPRVINLHSGDNYKRKWEAGKRDPTQDGEFHGGPEKPWER